MGRGGLAGGRLPAAPARRLTNDHRSTTSPGPPPLPTWRRWAGRHPRLVDGAIAGCVFLIGLPGRLHDTGDRPWLWALDIALAAPLIWRRRDPVAVFAVLAAAALVQWVLGVRLTDDVALLVALYTVAAYESRRNAIGAAAVLEVGAVLAAFRFAPARGVLASFVFLSGLVAAAFFIGTTVQTRRAYLAALVDRAARAERERDQQARLAATAERARLAREMHDVVAHSLTVVVTLAEAAAVASDTDPPAAKATMGEVATTGRAALTEMRRLLGVLRTDPGAEPGADLAGLAPVPGLDRLDELIGGARSAGLPVRLTVSGRSRPLPPTLDATAYRVVQEALTNVLKHAAGPSRVDVVVRWAAGAVTLAVIDDGRPNAAPGTAGHGLQGMRERLSLFGGELTAGPAAAGGWAVRVRLPLEEEAP
jgi:signal transduction histidine kinase